MPGLPRRKPTRVGKKGTQLSSAWFPSKNEYNLYIKLKRNEGKVVSELATFKDCRYTRVKVKVKVKATTTREASYHWALKSHRPQGLAGEESGAIYFKK